MPAEIRATFGLTKQDREVIFANNSFGPDYIRHGAASKLQFVYLQQGDGNLVLAELRGEWPRRGLLPFAVTAPRDDGNGFSAKVISGLQENESGVDPLTLKDQATVFSGWTPLDQSAGGSPSLTPIRQLLAEWGRRYYHFRALRPGAQRSMNLSVASRLEPTGQNLAAVLLDLLTNRPELLEKLRQLIAQIVPGIGKLEIRTSGNNMQVVFAANGAELNLKDLGTGVEQLLMTLVVGLTEVPPFVLLIEEPEANLHPAAQRALLGLFKEWATDRQIIVATHSPVMLDWSPAGDRLWHVGRADGVSTVAPVTEDLSTLFESLGVRRSDFLSANRVLIVEGSSDEDILETWFPEILRNPTVAILHGRGGDNARHSDLLAEWIIGIDRIGLRRILYLRDRDELSFAALNTLQAMKTVEVLKKRELENYLLDADAIADVLKVIVPDGFAAPPANDISRTINEVADSLRHKVVVNKVCRQIQPVEPLMDHKLRQGLANAAADQKTVTAAILKRLMREDDLVIQIHAAWAEAEEEVARCADEELLAVAPGEEILNEIFKRFARRRYHKRDDGVAIARAMPAPPKEIRDLLKDFMRD
jgi:hypothetical protein